MAGLMEHVSVSPDDLRRMDEEIAREKAPFVEKYGKPEGIRRYMAAKAAEMRYDKEMKAINTIFVWYGDPVWASGTFRCKAFARMRELYGNRYEELVKHERMSREIGKLLVDDAIRTGKWRELPDALQAEYHERSGGSE